MYDVKISFGMSLTYTRVVMMGLFVIVCCKLRFYVFLEACHSSPVGGHHSGICTAHKIFQCGYYWLNIHQDAQSCDRFQRDGGILKRQEINQNPILEIKLFDVWVIDFMDPFVSSHGMKYIVVVVDYMSKWVESIALSNNECKSVTTYLEQNIFSTFSKTMAIISECESHFCKKLFKGLLEKYGVHHNVANACHP